MGKWNKWISGGLGFVIGGPIGAIIGFALGTLIDHGGISMASGQTTHQGDFKMSLLVLMAAMMKADGKIVKAELNVVKKFLSTNFGEEQALDALQMLKKLLEEDYDVIPVCQQINTHLNKSTKLELVHLLIMVAHADGEYAKSEQRLLLQIAGALGLTQADYASLLAPYHKQENPNWAYDILEIPAEATNEEIKKAYRRMAMKYHPDKVNDLGEEIKKTATEKFRTVNEAYEALKKARGMA